MTRRLVLFDIDGTLLLSGGAGRRAILAAIADDAGIGPEQVDQVRFDGKTDPQIVTELFEAAGHPERPDQTRIGRIIDRYLGYLEQDFTIRTPHRYLVMCAPITEVEHVLHAIRPDPRVREFLRIEDDEPCLLLARRTWAGSMAATRSVFVYPGERYSLGGRYQVMGEAERPVLGSMLSGDMYRPHASTKAPVPAPREPKMKRSPLRRK